MSIFAPTKLKVVSFNDRAEVISNTATAAQASISVDLKKDLELVIVNTNTAADYAGATISITGTSLAGVPDNWLSTKVTGLLAGERTNNSIALKRGTTRLVLPAAECALMSQIKIEVVGTADSKLFVYTVWDDPVVPVAVKQISATVTYAFAKTTEKHLKISILPSGVDANNLVRMSANIAGNWKSDALLLSKEPRPAAITNYVYVTKQSDFYVNDVYALASLNLAFSCTGTATAQVLITEMDHPQDTKEFYVRVFETAVSIADAYNFKPDVSAKYVLCQIDSVLSAGSSAIVNLSNKSEEGTILPRVFTEAGVSAASNSILIEASGTRYFYIQRTSDIARIHAATTIVGASNNIRVSCVNVYSDLAGLASGAQPKSSLYRGDGFNVALHKLALNFSAYENWEAAVNIRGVLTVSDGVSAGHVSLTALPGWKAGDTIGAMGFIPFKKGGPDASTYSRETSMRLCFFTRLGNIYHNYPAVSADDKTPGVVGMADFDLSAIYEPVLRVSDSLSLSSERIPSTNSALTTEEKKLYRYQPGLPAWNYAQHSANLGGVKADASVYGSGGHPAVLEKNGIKLIRMVTPYEYGTNPQDAAKPFQMSGYLSNPFSVKPKCTVYTPYNGVNIAKNVVLGTVDGGRIWVVLHELGSSTSLSSYGNNFDYSSIGAYTSGALSVVRRSYIVPTAAVKDPVSCFQYADPVSATAITTTAGKAVVTTTVAHGLITGDLVCFKKMSAGNYDFLENTITVGNAAAFASNSAGDGRFYRAKVTGTTTFELLQNYNGLDEKIGTQHIHSSNPAKDGTVICCGEKYPNGWILFVRIPQIDDFEFFDPYAYRVSNRYIYRLNSAAGAMQRAVGLIWRDDKDQTMLFASDEQNIGARPLAIDGRDAAALPLRNTAGVFKGRISDIDDIALAEVVCEMEEASLGIVGTQGMFVVLGMSRKVYLSLDAVKWISFPLIASYVGESNGAIYLRSGSSIYKVTKL